MRFMATFRCHGPARGIDLNKSMSFVTRCLSGTRRRCIPGRILAGKNRGLDRSRIIHPGTEKICIARGKQVVIQGGAGIRAEFQFRPVQHGESGGSVSRRLQHITGIHKVTWMQRNYLAIAHDLDRTLNAGNYTDCGYCNGGITASHGIFKPGNR